jgi:hypothetical protein
LYWDKLEQVLLVMVFFVVSNHVSFPLLSETSVGTISRQRFNNMLTFLLFAFDRVRKCCHTLL